jgi:hypothetical protein
MLTRIQLLRRSAGSIDFQKAAAKAALWGRREAGQTQFRFLSPGFLLLPSRQVFESTTAPRPRPRLRDVDPRCTHGRSGKRAAIVDRSRPAVTIVTRGLLGQ